jgi:pimeloyl-ACP methyl ester carboxylesterase
LKIPKAIIYTGQFLTLISTRLATLFVAKIFIRPIRHKIPKREIYMDTHSVQTKISVSGIKEEIVVYQYGPQSDKKILLVHGWSGRGTQLYKIADAFIAKGYAVVSFDAPAHGKSTGSTSIIIKFLAAIFEVSKQFGPFEAAVGHSMGAMSLLNATKDGLNIKKLAIIGSGDKIEAILDDFIARLQLKPKIATSLALYFEKKFGKKLSNYAAHSAASKIDIPVLVIHDKNDLEVPASCSLAIHQNLKNSELLLTEKLGHRKILGNDKVISAVVSFIAKN